jgi:hypothetical protein
MKNARINVSLIVFLIMILLTSADLYAVYIAVPLEMKASLFPIQQALIKRTNDIIKQEIDKALIDEHGNAKAISAYPIATFAASGYIDFFSCNKLLPNDLMLLKKQCELLQALPLTSDVFVLPVEQKMRISDDEQFVTLTIQDDKQKLAHMHAVIKVGLQALNDVYQFQYKKLLIDVSILQTIWPTPVIYVVQLPKKEVMRLALHNDVWQNILQRIKQDVFSKIQVPIAEVTIKSLVLADRDASGVYAIHEQYSLQKKQ